MSGPKGVDHVAKMMETCAALGESPPRLFGVATSRNEIASWCEQHEVRPEQVTPAFTNVHGCVRGFTLACYVLMTPHVPLRLHSDLTEGERIGALVHVDPEAARLLAQVRAEWAANEAAKGR